jgi:hypothetical protein
MFRSLTWQIFLTHVLVSNLDSNLSIDNDKNLDEAAEVRIILKCTLIIRFQDFNYIAYTNGM